MDQLVSATLDVASGILTITDTYLDDTWSPSGSVFFVVLDLDENSATGPLSTSLTDVMPEAGQPSGTVR